MAALTMAAVTGGHAAGPASAQVAGIGHRHAAVSRREVTPRPPAHRAAAGVAPAYWVPYTGHRGSPYYSWVIAARGTTSADPQVAVGGFGDVAYAVNGNDPSNTVFLLSQPKQYPLQFPSTEAMIQTPLPLADANDYARTVHGLALNENADQVAASFTTSDPFTGATYYHVQVLRPDHAPITVADAGDPAAPGFSALGPEVAINFRGEVPFTGLAEHSAAWNVFVPQSPTAGQASGYFTAVDNDADGSDAVAVDGDGDVLAAETSSAPQQLRLYSFTAGAGFGATPTVLAAVGADGGMCAAPSGRWAALGSRPAISADGTMIAFAGRLAGVADPGIYLCYQRQPGGRWNVVTVAGGGNTADFGYTAANGPVNATITSGDMNSTVSLVAESASGSLPAGPGLHPGQSVTVGFAASPGCSSAPCPADPSVSHLIGSQRGIWAAQVVVQAAPQAGPVPPAVEVQRPWPVLQCGDYIDGTQVTNLDAAKGAPGCANDDSPLSFAMADHYIRDDGVNDAGNHYVALAVSTASGWMILRGDHTDIAGDGLVDAWKTAGIDFTGSGNAAANVKLPRASVFRRDLYVHVDSMADCPLATFGLDCPADPVQPASAVPATVTAIFRSAPVADPVGSGIDLSIEAPGPCTQHNNAACVPYSQFVQVGSDRQIADPAHTQSLAAYENSYLDEEDPNPRCRIALGGAFSKPDQQACIAAEAAKALAYRYVLYGSNLSDAPVNDGPGGRSLAAHWANGAYCQSAADCALYWWGGPAAVITDAQGVVVSDPALLDTLEIKSTVHELGHLLGLGHGGGDSVNCKPNYPSAMNYNYLLPINAAGYLAPGFTVFTSAAQGTRNDVAIPGVNSCDAYPKGTVLYGYDDWDSLQYGITWGLASTTNGSLAVAPGGRRRPAAAPAVGPDDTDSLSPSVWWPLWTRGDLAGDGVANGKSMCPFVDNPSQRPALCATTVSVTDSAAIEADAGVPGQLAFPVTVGGRLPSVPVTVRYATSDGTAIAGRDYVATAGTLTVPAGRRSAVIDVPLIGQAAEQASRSFTLTLSKAAGAGIVVPGRAVGAIVDGGPYLPPTATANGITVSRPSTGPATATIPVTLSGPSRDRVSIGYATANGSAAAGVDYTAASGTLTIPAGRTSGDITVPVLAAPSEEPPRTFYLNLSDPARVTLAASSVTVTLLTGGGAATIAVITSKPVTGPAAADATLGPLTVTEEDGFGRPVPAPAGGATVMLSSTSAPGVFSATLAGPAATSVTIPAGSGSATFYYGDAAAGAPVISVTVAHLIGTSQQETVTPAGRARLVIATKPVDGTASGQAGLGPITVQEDDAYGNPAPAPSGGTTVFLSSGSPTGVFAAASGGPAVTSVTIPAGSVSAGFYYGDPTVGSPTVTAAAEGMTSAAQTETVAASPPPVASCLHPTESWTGAAGDNNFDDPANWTAGVVPLSTYSVCIPATGATPITGGNEIVGSVETFTPLQLTGLTTVSDSQESAFHASAAVGGNLGFAGPTIIDGAGTVFTWTTDVGVFNGAGRLQVDSPATLRLIGLCDGVNGGCPEFSLQQLGIAAGATLGIEGIIAAASSQITNAGTISLTEGAVFGSPSAGATPPPVVTNSGIIVQADGTAGFIGGDLRLGGHVSVPAGTLTLTTTATESAAATFTVAEGAALDLDARLSDTLTLTSASPFTGAGTFETGHGNGGGTVVVDGTFALPALEVSNGTTLELAASDPIPALTVHSQGTLDLAGNLTIPPGGTATFQAANLSGAGNLTIAAGASLTLGGSGGDFSGTGTVTVDGTATVDAGAQPLLGQPLVNDGTLTLATAAGEPTILGCPSTPSADGGSFTNDGTLVLTGDDSVFPFGYGCTLTNTWTGTIIKAAGAPGGASTLGGFPVNAGAVHVDAGTLVWENDTGEGGVPAQAAVSSGAFTVGDAATLELWDRGTGIVLDPASQVTGPGTVQAADGAVAIDGELAVPAVTAVANSALTLGSGPLTLADLVVGSGASLDDAAGIVIPAGGSATFGSAQPQELSGPGSLTIDTGAALTLDGSGGLAGTGTITIEPGGAATVAGSQVLGQALVNDGTLTLATSASEGSSLGCPGYPAAGGGSLTNNGALILAGDASVFPFGYGCTLANTATGVISKTAGAPGGGSVLGGFPVNAGTVHVDTGTLIWENDTGQGGAPAQTASSPGGFTVAADAALQLRGYAIDLADGSSLSGAGTLVVSQTAGGSADTLAGTVTLPAVTVADGAAVTLAATTLPGTTLADDGTLTLPAQTVAVGGYAQSASGTLDIPLSSLTAFGAISAATTANLNGQVTVVPVPGFPPDGTSFAIITAAGGVTGTFTLVTALGGQGYDADYTPTTAPTTASVTRTS